MEGTERLFVVALLYMVAAAVAAGATRLSLRRDNGENTKKCRPRPAGPFWKATEHRVDAAEIAAHAALGAMTVTTKSMGTQSLSFCRLWQKRIGSSRYQMAVVCSRCGRRRNLEKSRICERILSTFKL
jgi:hypothetical protein